MLALYIWQQWILIGLQVYFCETKFTRPSTFDSKGLPSIQMSALTYRFNEVILVMAVEHIYAQN
jgi:hypothetical protein